jgi:tryptophan synthase beta chain
MKTVPDSRGYFGEYGGRFVPAALVEPLAELEAVYLELRADKAFQGRLESLQEEYVGRPTPLYQARRLSARLGGARIFLKREDLCHTGWHGINNALAMVLLAGELGRTGVVADTGGGQHGVAVATAATLFDLECTVYMGADDVARSPSSVRRIRLLGARVVEVDYGNRSLREAQHEALRHWRTNSATELYAPGSVVGPHPFPLMVRDFQSAMGREVFLQFRRISRGLPEVAVAAVGGGGSAAGLFSAFIPHSSVRLVGVEAGGSGEEAGAHASRFAGSGSVGIYQGARTWLVQDPHGQAFSTQSVSRGLSFPAVGPELAYWRDTGRVTYTQVSDRDALAACRTLTECEGIVPSLECAHAVAYAIKVAPAMALKSSVLVAVTSRGDHEVDALLETTEPVS